MQFSTANNMIILDLAPFAQAYGLVNESQILDQIQTSALPVRIVVSPQSYQRTESRLFLGKIMPIMLQNGQRVTIASAAPFEPERARI